MAPLAEIFGVRHFSPAGARHVRHFLEERDPQVVLIEGPSDATGQIEHLAHAATRPPVALLAFTKSRPVRSIIYPLAAYSPEWVALRFALERKREVRFIDLPASVFLELHDLDEDDAEGTGEARDHTRAYLDDPYEAIARLSGEPDHETWWERQFEHTLEVAAYRDAIHAFGHGLRELRRDRPARERETLLREAFMRREILAATAGGEKRAVVVCGAFHVPALTDALEPMGDAELEGLPRADCVLTLMPYSYPRLSSQSGYGAGNHAPAYYEALWEEAAAGRPERLRSRYFSDLAGRMRRQGIVRSSAEVIEAVRLAEGLASLNDSPAPALRDLRDAAITLLGQGDPAPLERALRQVEIGTAVGRLPPGVSRTALQDDFHHLVHALKLDRHLEDEEHELELDLREDRTRKTKEAALLDRARSTFLNRLEVLDIGFGRRRSRGQRGTSRELWRLRWSPECEVRLAEGSLRADSVESGAAFALAERLAEARDVGAAARILLQAADCELADSLSVALRRVQDLAVDESGFPAAAEGIESLAEVIRYGTVREVDPAPLRPVLAQLYLRASLLLFGATVCDDEATREVRAGMDRVQEIAFLGEPDVDPARWMEAVRAVAGSDSRNPFLSGYGAALLIERGELADEEIDREVSRRLSPGTEASVGVGWFEGLVQRNRAALFLRRPLWSSLSEYVDALDDEGFKRALLYLRRSFSDFAPGEVRRLADILGDVWKGVGTEALVSAVETRLDAEELKQVTDDLEGLDLL